MVHEDSEKHLVFLLLQKAYLRICKASSQTAVLRPTVCPGLSPPSQQEEAAGEGEE